ncbi:hypothetical protein [Brachybacterium hainanense]|uniref:DUF3093 domain-containing protein n=1 Tax=Brachybacterium hainanense TaxID=1541174 RepID=A0ABV6R7R4_9MICO
MQTMTGSGAGIWERVTAGPVPGISRPGPAPRAESVEEVAAWAGSEDFRRTTLVTAPVVWVLLPITALGFLVQQAVTDPTGRGGNASFFGETVHAWPVWFVWLIWIAVGIWLLVSVCVLALRLSVWRDLSRENRWIHERSVAHSIHRASVSYDDGEGGAWATHIALDHRLDDGHAARIHEAFEQWLLENSAPPGSGPISSEDLFGAAAKGGYYILHMPLPQTAGEPVEHQWLLITEPRAEGGDVLVTPVPVPAKLRRIRATLRRRDERRAR